VIIDTGRIRRTSSSINLLERVVIERRRIQLDVNLCGINFVTLFTRRKSQSPRAVRPPSPHQNHNSFGSVVVSYSIKSKSKYVYRSERVSDRSTGQGPSIVKYMKTKQSIYFVRLRIQFSYMRTESSHTARCTRIHLLQLLEHNDINARQHRLVVRPHRFNTNYTVRHDYSSPGRTDSTSTTLCAATTRPPAAPALHQLCRALRLLVSQSQRLYNNDIVCRDNSSPRRAPALHQLRRAPQLLVSRSHKLYIDYTVCHNYVVISPHCSTSATSSCHRLFQLLVSTPPTTSRNQL
jgi:hypothetical protein